MPTLQDALAWANSEAPKQPGIDAALQWANSPIPRGSSKPNMFQQFGAGALDAIAHPLEGVAQWITRKAGDPISEIERQSAAIDASSQPNTLDPQAMASMVPETAQERVILSPEVPSPIGDIASRVPAPEKSDYVGRAARALGSVPPTLAMVAPASALAGPVGGAAAIGAMSGAGALGENESALRAGEISQRNVPLTAAAGAGLGLAFGPLGAIPNKFARFGAEAALGTVGFPAIEGRPPSFEDYLFGAGFALPTLARVAAVKTPSRASLARALEMEVGDLPPDLATKTARESIVKRAQEEVAKAETQPAQEPPPVPETPVANQELTPEPPAPPQETAPIEPAPVQRVEPEQAPPPAQESSPDAPMPLAQAPVPGTIQRPETYFRGDRAEYTGKTQDDAGGPLYEIEIMEGHLKGQKKHTYTAPDGSNPVIATKQALEKKNYDEMQEGFRRLRGEPSSSPEPTSIAPTEPVSTASDVVSGTKKKGRKVDPVLFAEYEAAQAELRKVFNQKPSRERNDAIDSLREKIEFLDHRLRTGRDMTPEELKAAGYESKPEDVIASPVPGTDIAPEPPVLKVGRKGVGTPKPTTFDTSNPALEQFRQEMRAQGIKPPTTLTQEDLGYPERGVIRHWQDKEKTTPSRYTWDQALERAQELGLITESNPSPDALGKLFKGEAKSKGVYSDDQENFDYVRKRQEKPINEAELDVGDFVYTNGEWHKVKSKTDEGTILQDGDTISLENFESVPAKEVITKDSPVYQQAAEEYRKQERGKLEAPLSPDDQGELFVQEVPLSDQAKDATRLYGSKANAIKSLSKQRDVLLQGGESTTKVDALINELGKKPKAAYEQEVQEAPAPEPMVEAQSAPEPPVPLPTPKAEAPAPRTIAQIDADIAKLQSEYQAARKSAKPSQAVRKIDRELDRLYKEHGDLVAQEEAKRKPRFSKESGYLNVGAAASEVRKGKNAVTGWIKRNFTAEGELPKDVYEANYQRVSSVNRYNKMIEQDSRDFARATKEWVGSRRLTDSEARMLDNALKGQTDIRSLPEPMRAPIQKFRDTIDGLSREMIDLGIAEGEMAARFEKNIGQYVTRAYQAHVDPKWAEKVPLDVRNRAKAWLRSIDVYADATDADIEGKINSLLYNGKAADGPIKMLSEGKLGSKDLSTLMRRKDLPQELLDLYGEFHDPMLNYTLSVMKMGRLIASDKFLKDVRRMGEGRFLSEKETPDLYAKIAADESSAMSPLNGMYTTPEIKAEFERAYDTKPLHGVYKAYMTAMGTTKAAKTVLSVVTHVRNFTGNTLFSVAAGDFNPRNYGKAAKAVLADWGKLDTAKRREFLQDLTERGILDTDVSVGEFNDILKEVTERDLFGSAAFESETTLRKGMKVVSKAYQSGDNFWKMARYLHEAERYGKAHPEWTSEQIKSKAAEIVRDTMPNYRKLSRAVKAFRRFPVTAPFVSFPAETIRVGKNLLKLSYEEIQNPATRSIGRQRAIGILAAATLPTAVAYTTKAMLGVDDKTDHDLRRFLPPYMSGSQVAYMGKGDDGTYRVIDLGFIDPWSYLKSGAVALLSGENWQDGLVNGLAEYGQAWFGEEILAGKIMDVMRNTTANGRQVYNPEASPWQQTKSIAAHIYDAFEPGTITTAKRIVKAHMGQTSPSGRAYEPSTEWASAVLGMRAVPVDVKQGLEFKARAFNERMRSGAEIFTGTVKRRGSVSDDEISSSHSEMEASRKRIFDEMVATVQAAERLGVSKAEIAATLRGNNVSADMVQGLMNAAYKPYSLSKDMRNKVLMVDPKRIPKIGTLGASQ